MKDKKTEEYLKREQYVFMFSAHFPIADIDMREAEANPARLGKALDDDRAYGYSEDMVNGADFPAIVLLDIGDGVKKLLITGRHRLAAAGAAMKTTFDAYIVREADPCRRELLVRSINCIEGSAPQTDERLSHIAEMCRKYPGLKVADLASKFRVKKELVESYLKMLAVELRADSLGVGPLMLTNRFSQRLKLAVSHVQNDHAFIAAVQLVSRYPALRASAGLDLLGRLKTSRTEAMSMRILDEAEKEQVCLEEEKKITKTPRTKASKAMGLLRTLKRMSGGSVDALHLPGLSIAHLPSEMRLTISMRNLLNEMIDQMAHLIAEHERTQQWRTKTRDGAQESAPDSVAA